MNWKQLSKIAFLGAYRAGLEAANLRNSQAPGLSDEEEPGAVLLKAMVFSGIRERAGKKCIPLAEYSRPKHSPPATELSSMAALFLESILEDRFSKALKEMLQLCKAHQKTLPTYLIPELMLLVEDQTLAFSDIDLLLSDSASALLGMHPDWKKYAECAHPSDWLSTDPAKRIGYIAFLRKIHPEEAIRILQPSWEQEPYRLKLSFLKSFRAGLSLNDEHFLEKCLDDPQKNIRKKAAALLALLPDSTLSVQLFEYMASFLEETNDERLIVHLPQQAEPYWLHLGLQNKKTTAPYQSKSATLLGSLIEYLHPSYWSTFLNAPPKTCLEKIEQTPLSDILLHGLVSAVLLHQEQEWADAMADRLFSEKKRRPAVYVEVLEKISPETFNQLLTRQLKNQAFLIEEDSLAYSLIQLSDHPWADELAKAVILPFQQWLSTARSAQWQVWHYKKILEIASYRINPNLLSFFRNGWQFQSYIAYQWQEEIEKFNNTLAFRKGMHKAIMEKTTKT